jgi:hypothetical protein
MAPPTSAWVWRYLRRKQIINTTKTPTTRMVNLRATWNAAAIARVGGFVHIDSPAIEHNLLPVQPL